MGQLVATLHWILGLGIGLGLPLYLAVRWRSLNALVDVPRPQHYLKDEEFVEACKALPDPCAAAESLIERAREVYRGYIDSATALEGKAATLLGFVGGGVSLVSVLAGSEKLVRPQVTPLLAGAAVALLAMLIATLQVLRPRARGAVNVERVSDVRAFSAATAKPTMDATIGREYIEAARTMIPAVTVKARWLNMVYGCFAVGVAAIALNLLLPLRQPAHGPATSAVRCRAAGPELNCTLTQGETP